MDTVHFDNHLAEILTGNAEDAAFGPIKKMTESLPQLPFNLDELGRLLVTEKLLAELVEEEACLLIVGDVGGRDETDVRVECQKGKHRRRDGVEEEVGDDEDDQSGSLHWDERLLPKSKRDATISTGRHCDE